MIFKLTKNGKIRCPECNKLTEPYEDIELNVMVLECCKRWSLYPLETVKIKPKPKPEIEDKGSLLRMLYERKNNGKKEKE